MPAFGLILGLGCQESCTRRYASNCAGHAAAGAGKSSGTILRDIGRLAGDPFVVILDLLLWLRRCFCPVILGRALGVCDRLPLPPFVVCISNGLGILPRVSVIFLVGADPGASIRCCQKVVV